MQVWSLDQEDSPGEGNGNPRQYSCLENPFGQRSLTGYSPWGRKQSDLTEYTQTHINPRSRHCGKYRQNMPPQTPTVPYNQHMGRGSPARQRPFGQPPLSSIYSCTASDLNPRAWMWLTGATPGLDYPTTWALESVIWYSFSTDCRTGNAWVFWERAPPSEEPKAKMETLCLQPFGQSQVKVKSPPRPN